jgi:hypothetical protein
VVSYDAPAMMRTVFAQTTSPTRKQYLRDHPNERERRRITSTVSKDAPELFHVPHVPVKPSALQAKIAQRKLANRKVPATDYVDLMATPRVYVEPAAANANALPASRVMARADLDTMGVVPSPRRPEAYDDMENEVNLQFGGAAEIEELEHQRLDKAKRAWRWFLRRKDSSLHREKLIDETLEEHLLSALYDLGDHRCGVTEAEFVREVARARGPILNELPLDEHDPDNNSWPLEIRLAFLNTAKQLRKWDTVREQEKRVFQDKIWVFNGLDGGAGEDEGEDKSDTEEGGEERKRGLGGEERKPEAGQEKTRGTAKARAGGETGGGASAPHARGDSAPANPPSLAAALALERRESMKGVEKSLAEKIQDDRWDRGDTSHLVCGFRAKAAFREHQAMVKLHAAKHSIHDAIKDNEWLHHGEEERQRREREHALLRRRGGGGALARRPGYRRPPPIVPRRPPSPQFEILRHATKGDDLARLRAKHDADKRERMLAHTNDPSARSGGSGSIHQGDTRYDYHGPTVKVLHHPLTGPDMLRLQKKAEAGLHAVADAPHGDLGHRRRNPVDYRHDALPADPHDDHSHGNARVVCQKCTAVVRRTHAACHYCGNFLPLPKREEHLGEDGHNVGFGPGWNQDVTLKRAFHLEKTVKNTKLDVHHIREFALDHLRKQCHYIPGLTVDNPGVESLRRAHRAFNVAFQTACEEGAHAYEDGHDEKHVHEVDFEHFMEHFQGRAGHKHRTKIFPSAHSTAFSPRLPPTKQVREFMKKMDHAKAAAAPQGPEPTVVDLYVRNTSTPEFYRSVAAAKGSVQAQPTPPPTMRPNRRGRRLSYIGLTKKRAGELYRKGLRAAVGVRRLQRAAGHAEERKRHIPFHTGADGKHVDKHHERIERGVSMHLGKFEAHIPAARTLKAAAPRKHHVLGEEGHWKRV